MSHPYDVLALATLQQAGAATFRVDAGTACPLFQ